MIYRSMKLFACAILLAFPAAASALTVLNAAVFDLTVGSNSGVVDGNARYFTATSPSFGTFKTRVTGWSLEKTASGTFVRDSKLMVYSGGLGVISGDDGNGDQNRHTIDNSVRQDFLLFQFDRPAIFVEATFNTFSVLGQTRDSDAIFKYGMLDGPPGNPFSAYNLPLNLNNQDVSVLDALFDGEFTSLSPVGANGASNTRLINPDEHYGNIWLVGADFLNKDGKIDGFKFNNLAVVPEPSIWAMMIGGFGLMGAVIRRRGSRRKQAQMPALA